MKERLSDKIYQGIKADIISGALKGNSFLVEGEVAEQYAVSRAPAKAALQSLAQEGFLICFPRKGYMVATISVEEYKYVREIRLHLEQLSVKLAIQRASDAEIDSLRQVIGQDTADNLPYKTHNTNFHLRLAEITHNPFIGDVLQKYLGLTARYALAVGVDNTYHTPLIDALARRDLDSALHYLVEDLNADIT